MRRPRQRRILSFVVLVLCSCMNVFCSARLVRYPRLYLSVVPLGLDPLLPVPEHNDLTREKTALGRRLFFDKRLSRDESLACASCHVPARTFTDGRALPLGITGARGRRNAPTLVNRAYGRSMFWDGRAASLEEQALAPLVSPTEFGTSYEEVLRRLRADPQYPRLFRRAFGTEEITIEDVARALASFERTLLSGDSAFDRYETLKDSRALSGPARRGLSLFRGKAACVVCHNAPLFSDERFHNTGVSWEKLPLDLGRYEVTGREEDKGVFKTPACVTWRAPLPTCMTAA